MKKTKRTPRPSGSNPVAKNAWRQNRPKVIPDKRPDRGAVKGGVCHECDGLGVCDERRVCRRCGGMGTL